MALSNKPADSPEIPETHAGALDNVLREDDRNDDGRVLT